MHAPVCVFVQFVHMNFDVLEYCILCNLYIPIFYAKSVVLCNLYISALWCGVYCLRGLCASVILYQVLLFV